MYIYIYTYMYVCVGEMEEKDRQRSSEWGIASIAEERSEWMIPSYQQSNSNGPHRVRCIHEVLYY